MSLNFYLFITLMSNLEGEDCVCPRSLKCQISDWSLVSLCISTVYMNTSLLLTDYSRDVCPKRATAGFSLVAFCIFVLASLTVTFTGTIDSALWTDQLDILSYYHKFSLGFCLQPWTWSRTTPQWHPAGRQVGQHSLCRNQQVLIHAAVLEATTLVLNISRC